MDKNFLEDILKKLKKKGAEEADVVFFSSKNKSSSCRLGEIEKTEESVTNEIGIRAIIKKRQSIISSTNIETSNINSLIEKVIEMVKVVPKDEYCGLANNNQVSIPSKKDLESLELFDEYEPDKKEINDKVLLLEQSALNNKKIINSEGAELSYTKSKYILMASNGLESEITKTHSDYILAVLAGNKSNMERAYDYKSKVFFNDLGDFNKIGKKVASDALKKIGSKKIKTCKCDVIYDSKIASSILNNLFNACNASSIIKGTTFLKKKKNKKIFNDTINIIDNPLMKRKLRSRVIDGEGIKTEEKKLIENGVLRFFFNCLSTARQIKDDPSGHGTRPIASIPSASHTNLYLENGKHKKKDMIMSLKKGLLITELIGSSVNLSNGDYSRGASGFWIENGQITYPVSEITIAGNLKDIFQSLIPANDLEFNFGINSPSLLIRNLTVGGI
ncbi:MAG: modulator protein [Rickettsiales bacterium]|nr:modulator protein [Rickettsiales bacterium]RPG13819.1 MAG: TldD/PmbA family protein [Pelagibacteraceae bacterium TMED195]|tara:strand:+ start:1712 stop:3052 length:1341 start_codon:yes stop_codon:yes gene_type:complete